MSVVRKHQSGGTISTKFKDFAMQNLDRGSFTPDALVNAEEAISLFDKLAQEENINEIFTIDPKQGKYTINVDKIKNPELREINWTGSNAPGRKNFFGTYTSKDIRGEEGSGKTKYMGLGADLLNKFLKSDQATTTSSVVQPKRTYNLASLQDYIVNLKFKGENLPFDRLLGQDTSEAARQNKLIELSKESLQSYINQASLEGHSPEEYRDLDKAKQALGQLNNPNIDFESARQTVLGLGWDLLDEGYYEDPAEVATKKEQEVQKASLENQEAFLANLEIRGIPKHIAEQWYQKGWTKISSNLPQHLQDEQLTNWFTGLKGFTLSDETGANLELMSPEGEVLSQKIFELSSSLYGSYLGKDALGRITHYKPGVKGYKNPDQDVIAGKGYRGISGTVNGQEWEILGVPERTEGKLNYTNRLLVKDPNTDKTIEVYRDPSGLYKDVESGNTLEINLNTFTDRNDIPVAWKDDNTVVSYYDVLENLESDTFKTISEGSDMNFEALQGRYNSLSEEWISRRNQDQWKDLVGNLKYKIKSGRSVFEKEKAAELYYKLLNTEGLIRDLPKEITPSNDSNSTRKKDPVNEAIHNFLFGDKGPKKRIWDKKKETGVWKKGGIIKAQGGVKVNPAKRVSWEEYTSKINSKETVSKEEATKPIRDWKGTIKDMSDMEKASLVASLATVLPGVGVIGGLTSAGINLTRKGQGEDVSWGEIAMDLGFAGLGLVGLGGVGAAAKAAKLAKTAKDTAKIGREASKVGKPLLALRDIPLKKGLEKLAKATPELKTPRALGITKAELQALKKENIIGSKVNVTTAFKKDSQAELAEKAKKFLEQKKSLTYTSKVPLKPTVTEKGFLDSINPKVANVLGYGKYALAAPAVLAVPSVVSDVAEGGLGNIQATDLTKLAYGTSAALGIRAGKQLSKDIKSLIKTKTGKPSLVIANKKYDVDMELPTELKVPSTKYKLLGREKAKEEAKKIKEENIKALNEFKKKFEEKTKIKLGDDVGFKDIKQVQGKESFTGLLGEKSGEANLMTPEQYKRVVKAIENNNSINYFKPSWRKKEGGIIKAQWGTKLPFFSTAVKAPTLNVPFSTALKAIPEYKESKDFKIATLNYADKIFGKKSMWEGSTPKIQTGNLSTAPIDSATGALPKEGFTYKTLLKEIDPLSAINLLKLTSSNFANKNRIVPGLMKANEASLVMAPMVPNLNISTGSQFNPLYQNAAAENRVMGRRIANVTDLDKGMSARLGAEKVANEALIKGDLVNQDFLNRVRATQSEANYKNLLTNLQTDTENKARIAQVASKRHLIGAEAAREKAAQFDQYLSSVGSGIEAKRLKKEKEETMGKYFSLINNPEYKNLSKQYNDEYSEIALANLKKQFEDSESKLATKSNWEQSQQYLEFMKRKEDLKKLIEEKASALQTGILAYRMGLTNIPGYRKGGSIEDKLILEEARSRNRLILQRAKYYQDILKNTGKMRSSLLSLFK